MRVPGVAGWTPMAVALVGGVLLSFWLTHISPWARNGLAQENDFLRAELAHLQATTCAVESRRHAAAATAVLRDQLETRDQLIAELTARLANCSNASRTAAECETPFQAIPPFQPHRSREVLDWESFDRGFVYSWRRYWSVNGHQGNLRKELQEGITASKQFLNSKGYSWQHGQFQLDSRRGITYLMDFEKIVGGSKRFKRVRMFRPISSTVYPYPTPTSTDQQNRSMHMVVPLQGRAQVCEEFLKRLQLVAHKRGDPPFRLTVVYFDTQAQAAKSRKTIEAALSASADLYGLQYKLIVKSEPFSRGKGLMYGVKESPRTTITPPFTAEEVLAFMDIDMIFTREYLWRCRANAAVGESVYFPIPFSLYKGMNATVAHDNGKWRIYGLGMVCISESDFAGTKGYDTRITGWGREDVDFYERMLKNASLQVMRAVDEGLIHMWHEKVCHKAELTTDQYQDCIQSRADWEGDKVHLSLEIAKYREKYGEL